jgi:hypothetical protein
MPSDRFNQPTGTQAPAASGRERRRDPRYSLIAEARVIDIGSGSEFKVRISELLGIRFVDPKPTQQAVLNRWIAELAAGAES